MMRTDEPGLNTAAGSAAHGIRWTDAREAPFSLHGLCNPRAKGEPFRRMPEATARSVSEAVGGLSLHTAGGRVRFATDSPFVALRVGPHPAEPMDHMAFTGIFGFDVYVRLNGAECFAGVFRPSVDPSKGFEATLELPGDGMREVTVNLPLYSGVSRLEIGLPADCTAALSDPYAVQRPVVYYGSSITQGGCASRPGNSYPAMISRMLNCDFLNLGFSGSAKGEQAMADYIAGLDMSVFVCDYDHNARTADELQATHERLFMTVRERNPDLPIVLVTRPDSGDPLADECRHVVWTTFENALARGDHRVSFVNGSHLFDGPMADSCTVDGCHPNDLGFFRMAQRIGSDVERWLNELI